MSKDPQLRQIKGLLREIRAIEDDCGGKSREEEAKDPFAAHKRELHELLTDTKQQVQTQKSLKARQGQSPQEIKARAEVNKKLQRGRELVTTLEEDLAKQKRATENNKKNALPPEEIEKREEILGLLKQDVEYTEWDFNPKDAKKERGTKYNLARQAKERSRARRKEMGANAPEPQPLTAKQQAFIQETMERNEQIDNTLDQILHQVRVLNQMADDVNVELEAQDEMLNELGQKIDKTTEKIQNNNARLKKILDESGGATRWCPIGIACIILLALLGYIWQLTRPGGR